MRLIYGGTGISTSYPSPTTIVLGLGPDLPWADEPSPGNLGLSTCKFLAYISLLIPAFSLLHRPRLLPVPLQPVHYAPLPLRSMNDSITLSLRDPCTLSRACRFFPVFRAFALYPGLPHFFLFRLNLRAMSLGLSAPLFRFAPYLVSSLCLAFMMEWFIDLNPKLRWCV